MGEEIDLARQAGGRLEERFFGGRLEERVFGADQAQPVREVGGEFLAGERGHVVADGFGQCYLACYQDGKSQWLDGSQTYRLRIPANPPAAQFWSVTLYSADTRLPLKNHGKKNDLSSRDGLAMNPDGTCDLQFSPEAPKTNPKNWVRTNPGEGWFVYFRIYGVKQEFLDRTWVLNDFERLG